MKGPLLEFKGLKIDLTALAALVIALGSGIGSIISAVKGVRKRQENKPRRTVRHDHE